MQNSQRVLKKILSILFIAVAILCLVLLLFFFIGNRYPLSATVANINIGLLTEKQAQERLVNSAEKFLQSNFLVEINSKQKTFTPNELGISVFPQETLTALKAKLSPADFFGADIDVPVLVEVDENKLFSTLDKAFGLSKIAPRNAAYVFETGGLSITPEKKGKRINRKEVLKALRSAAQDLSKASIGVVLYDEEPKITALDLQEHEEKIREKINKTIILADPVYSEDWELKLTNHLDWLTFEPATIIKIPGSEKEITLESERSLAGELIEGKRDIIIKIKEEKLNEFIDAEIAQWLDVPIAPVNIYRQGEDVIIEGQGINGKKVDRPNLKKAIEMAIQENVNKLTIPVVDIEPEINISPELQKMGIKERISVGHTSYYGSPANRSHNIAVGSANFNGILIAPGEIFSFNKTLGTVDSQSGYKMELVIKPEGTIPEYGGGLCQVSTTFYRAILFAGLPVTERRQHTYAVSYYSQVLGHGLDATIYLGGQDLKFQNDTGAHILVQTYIKNNNELFVIFYGTDIGRKVQMEGPYLSDYNSAGETVYQETDTLPAGEQKQVEKAHTGFKALWYRHITDNTGKTTVEPINSTYKAVPSKVLVGTNKDEAPAD